MPTLEAVHSGMRWLDLLSALHSFWTQRERGQLETVEWIRSWFGSESYAYFALDDTRPSLHHCPFGISLAQTPAYLRKEIGAEDEQFLITQAPH